MINSNKISKIIVKNRFCSRIGLTRGLYLLPKELYFTLVTYGVPTYTLHIEVFHIISTFEAPAPRWVLHHR